MNLDFGSWDQWLQQRRPRHMQPAPANEEQADNDTFDELSEDKKEETVKRVAAALLMLILHKGF